MSDEIREMTRQFVTGAAFQKAVAAAEEEPYAAPVDFLAGVSSSVVLVWMRAKSTAGAR